MPYKRFCCLLAWHVLTESAAQVGCPPSDDSALLQLKPGEGPSEYGYFTWMSDLHGDPFYTSDIRQCRKKSLLALKDQAFGAMGCDPPISLMISAASAAKAKGRETSFLLYTGDFSRHAIELMPDPHSNVSNVIGQVASVIKGHFADTPAIFGALGNDDGMRNYFQLITSDQPANDWFVLVAERLSSSWSLGADAAKEYKYGGYFETRAGNLTILSLATVIYSVRHEPAQLEVDPFGQFAWLSHKLKAAVHDSRKVWIIGHIPPGIETFGYTELWHPVYLARYLEIVQDQILGSVIAAQLFGHVHKDEFRILPNPPPGAGPILLTASLSPVYYNNPSFKVVKYCKATGRLLDFEAFVTKIAAELNWYSAYGFNSTFSGFRPEGLLMEDFLGLRDRLLLGLREFELYSTWYTSDYPSELQHWTASPDDTQELSRQKLQRRHQYACALTVQSQQARLTGSLRSLPFGASGFCLGC